MDSLSWTLDTPLTAQARLHLATTLDAGFTDELSHRTGMHFSPDVRIYVAPEEDSFRLIAHWLTLVDWPPTRPSFVIEQVRRSLAALTGAPAPRERSATLRTSA